MPRQLFASLMMNDVARDDVEGSVAVVIDVLRASTTIVHALAAGAAAVAARLTTADALAGRQHGVAGQTLLGGERRGLRPEGFDLGNSPAEYTAERVAGKTIVFTTTNGTKAIIVSAVARRIVVGAFVNAAAVCRLLAAEPRVYLTCAATDNQYSADDVLAAGLIVDRLTRQGAWQLNPAAEEARRQWQAAFPDGRTPPPDELAAELKKSRGGMNLVRLGLDADILDAARIDRFDFVPEVSREDLLITQATRR